MSLWSLTEQNSGKYIITNKKAYVKGYEEEWFHKDAITNILANMSHGFMQTMTLQTRLYSKPQK